MEISVDRLSGKFSHQPWSCWLIPSLAHINPSLNFSIWSKWTACTLGLEINFPCWKRALWLLFRTPHAHLFLGWRTAIVTNTKIKWILIALQASSEIWDLPEQRLLEIMLRCWNFDGLYYLRRLVMSVFNVVLPTQYELFTSLRENQWVPNASIGSIYL